jgi:hypothetical protein
MKKPGRFLHLAISAQKSFPIHQREAKANSTPVNHFQHWWPVSNKPPAQITRTITWVQIVFFLAMVQRTPLRMIRERISDTIRRSIFASIISDTAQVVNTIITRWLISFWVQLHPDCTRLYKTSALPTHMAVNCLQNHHIWGCVPIVSPHSERGIFFMRV